MSVAQRTGARRSKSARAVRVSDQLGRAARIGTMLVPAAVIVFMMVALFSAVFRTQESLVTGGLFSGMSLDNLQFNWEQIMNFEDGIFLRWMRNSVVLSVGATVLSVGASIPAGYALALLRFPLRRVILYVTMLAMVIPNTVLVIPLFLGVAAVGQVNELLPVLVIMGFYPFGTYLAFIHYSTAMPPELVEAARIDGCSEIQVFRHIALPLAKQAVALVAFFSFVAAWANYFLPLVLLPITDKAPVSVGLQQLISQSQLYDPNAGGLDVELLMPQLALAATVQMLPILLVFIAAQRYLIRGVNVGAVKG